MVEEEEGEEEKNAIYIHTHSYTSRKKEEEKKGDVLIVCRIFSAATVCSFQQRMTGEKVTE